MNEHLLRMKKDTKFCTFDFEAEDLNLYSAKPWQFACVVGTQQRILRRHDLFIKWPNFNISREAEQITRFDRVRWENEGRDPKEVFQIANQEFAEAEYIVGHNILGYDIAVYIRSCRRLGIEPYPIQDKLIDTMACGKGIKFERFYKPDENFLSYQIRMANEMPPKRGFATLTAFAKLYDIHLDETRLHDALYDVAINFEVLKKMLWQIEK